MTESAEQKKYPTKFHERMAALRSHLCELHDRIKDQHLPGKGLTPREYVWNAIREVDRAVLDASESTGTLEVPRSQYEIVSEGGAMSGSRETHESFGAAQLTRCTGRKRLVGAVLDAHPNFITLSISRAERMISDRLHDEYWMPREHIVELNFSVYQWAELVSSMNGTVVPCTIQSVFRVDMEPVPEQVKSVFERTHKDALKSVMSSTTDVEKAFVADVGELKKKVEELGVSKTKASAVTSLLHKLVEDYLYSPKSTAAWAAQRLNEEAEKAVTNIKLETAAAMTSIVQRAGINALNQPGVDVHKLLAGSSESPAEEK